ncbi:SPOCS domain-containing protein [Peptococcaceae bacterium 1198_IL3148]
MTPVTVNSRGDPETKTVRVKKLIGSNRERLIARYDMILPQRHPTIDKVICIKDLMHNHYAETIAGRVLIKGSITFEITYLAAGKNQHNCFWTSITYYDFIDIPETTPEMVAEINASIDSVTLIGFNKETRMLTVEVAIDNQGLVYDIEEISLITHLPADYSGDFEEITINDIVSVGKGYLTGVEEICIPLNKPPIKKIVNCNSMPLLQKYQVDLGSVTVYGWLNLSLTYLDHHDQRRYLEKLIPFKKILATPQANDQLLAETFIISHQMEYNLLSDKCVQLKHNSAFKACVYAAQTLRVLTESNGMHTKKSSLTCEALADLQRVDIIIKESSPVNQGLADGEIKDLKLGPINFLVKQLVNNKVLIRGYVEFLVGYTEPKLAGHKYFYRKGFFKAVAEVGDVPSDARVELIPTVNFTKAYFNSDKLTINCQLNIIVKVLNLKQMEIVTEISGPDAKVAEEVSFTYVMQPGDEVETLANRFGTTVEAIYKLNQQLTPPFENKKIQIPCQIKKDSI